MRKTTNGNGDAIMRQVKENHERLESCNKHDFSIDQTPGKTLAKQWQCVHCDGVVDTINKKWYEEGVRDGVKEYFDKGK